MSQKIFMCTEISSRNKSMDSRKAIILSLYISECSFLYDLLKSYLLLTRLQAKYLLTSTWKPPVKNELRGKLCCKDIWTYQRGESANWLNDKSPTVPCVLFLTQSTSLISHLFFRKDFTQSKVFKTTSRVFLRGICGIYLPGTSYF